MINFLTKTPFTVLVVSDANPDVPVILDVWFNTSDIDAAPFSGVGATLSTVKHEFWQATDNGGEMSDFFDGESPVDADQLWEGVDARIAGIIPGHLRNAIVWNDGVDCGGVLQLAFSALPEVSPRTTASPAALGAPYGNDRSQTAVDTFAHGYGVKQ